MEEKKYGIYQQLLKSNDAEKQYQFAKELQKDGDIEHAKILFLRASLKGHIKAKKAYYSIEGLYGVDYEDMFGVATFGDPYDKYFFITLIVSILIFFVISFFL